ncbi:hypothetical protein [Desulforhabdus sp. TSK]|uniref:hypothetical protein n=1 Tax=Desulforhabdus sp. TSK TaxID=2925014 RepID=UPI001FC82B5A|nr:hypothetical protein [Desulforhabdus sp. TSK]GKT08652.1 hypothetical protein DSTSK_19570 [Desulforhabdus sp. TSK]
MRSSFLKKCTPSVSRHWLLMTAGLFWAVVGAALCVTACSWLSTMEWPTNALGVVLGFGGGVVVYRYGFSRIARKNIRRIAAKPENVCLFAFQAWRSYLLVLVMMSLGYFLRHSHTPRLILTVVYAAVGTGLTLSSTLYLE